MRRYIYVHRLEVHPKLFSKTPYAVLHQLTVKIHVAETRLKIQSLYKTRDTEDVWYSATLHSQYTLDLELNLKTSFHVQFIYEASLQFRALPLSKLR